MQSKLRRTSFRAASASFCLAVLPLAPPAAAQVFVAAGDGKQILVDGVQSVPLHPAADTAMIFTLKGDKPHVVATLKVPASVIGPPCSVAISPDGRYAIVTAAKRVAADPSRIEPDDTVSVIALGGRPRVVQRTRAGAGASGVAFSPDGRRVLIANRAAGTVSLFRFEGGRLTRLDTLDLGNADAAPASPLFLADGKRALLTRDGDNQVSLLTIAAGKLALDAAPVMSAPRPYEITSGRARRYAVVGSVDGVGTRVDAISLIDLTGRRPRVIDTETAGVTVEGVRMSADGRFVAATVTNGTNMPHDAPAWRATSELQVWTIKGGKLVRLASAAMGPWAQGAAWSRDDRRLVAESMDAGIIQVFAFDGHRLNHRADLAVTPGPAGIAGGD